MVDALEAMTQPIIVQAAETSQDLEERKLRLEEERLALDRQRLEASERRADQQHTLMMSMLEMLVKSQSKSAQ